MQSFRRSIIATPRCLCRYAVAFELPQDAALEGMFYELAEHPYVVRVSKTSDGGLHLIVTGEEHDQGIPAEEFHDFFGRSGFTLLAAVCHL